jgi:hypothetical protein
MIQAFGIALLTGLFLGVNPHPTDKGLRAQQIVFKEQAPRNRKEKRGFKPHPKHRPVI